MRRVNPDVSLMGLGPDLVVLHDTLLSITHTGLPDVPTRKIIKERPRLSKGLTSFFPISTLTGGVLDDNVSPTSRGRVE